MGEVVKAVALAGGGSFCDRPALSYELLPFCRVKRRGPLFALV